MTIPKFKPIKITTNEPGHVFDDYPSEMSKIMVESIFYGIKYGKTKVTFATIDVPCENGEVILSVRKEDFIRNLKSNMEILKEFEEYEICAEIWKILEGTK